MPQIKNKYVSSLKAYNKLEKELLFGGFLNPLILFDSILELNLLHEKTLEYLEYHRIEWSGIIKMLLISKNSNLNDLQVIDEHVSLLESFFFCQTIRKNRGVY